MTPDRSRCLWPAGWALRRFAPEDIQALHHSCAPSIVEISKECFRERSSLKELSRALSAFRARCPFELAFAGTTDLVGCSGFPWSAYRRYIGVQLAQAKFLECSMFRLLFGKSSPLVSVEEMIRRVLDLCDDFRPLTPCIEIHAGFESLPPVLAALVDQTPVQVVVDIENAMRADLTVEVLSRIVPSARIAYFHQRNLGDTWVEHPASLVEERRYRELYPGGVFLWEPKTVDEPGKIQEIYLEYQSPD
jgi:hypothetical protein